jgi:uncharacterized protein (TIGR02231 family)
MAKVNHFSVKKGSMTSLVLGQGKPPPAWEEERTTGAGHGGVSVSRETLSSGKVTAFGGSKSASTSLSLIFRELARKRLTTVQDVSPAMKTPFALIAFVAAIALSNLSGAPLGADSHIAAVTVYADRAVITREATLEIKAAGIVEVAFEKLPAELMDDSLQVTGSGSAQTTLLDVTARPTFTHFTPNERVKAIEDELHALHREDRTLVDRTTVLTQQRDYVLKIQGATTAPTKDGSAAGAPADTWMKLLAFSEDQLSKIAAELQSSEAQREELQIKRTALEQELNQLRAPGGRSHKTVTVRLDNTAAGTVNLTLRYAVTGASWTPAYDARVVSTERSVRLGYFGLVRQNTGEDWPEVDLTLSTARPSLGGAVPDLQPWVVQQREIQQKAARDQEDVILSPFTVDAEKKGYNAAATLAGSRIHTEMRDVASAVTVVTQQFLQDTGVIESHATSATFRIGTKTAVPSDNAPHKVGVTTLSLQADLRYQATPKLFPGAFLSAAVSNTSEFPLLAGAMSVFLDDAFVASSSLRSVMPGEKFDLALGADEGITVKRRLNNRFTEDTGVVSKGKRITYDVTLTVQNNKKTDEKIILRDQVPVSRHEKIVVKLLAPSDKDMKPDPEGILKWTLDLKAGEKRELPLKFSVEYPNDFPVVGLE